MRACTLIGSFSISPNNVWILSSQDHKIYQSCSILINNTPEGQGLLLSRSTLLDSFLPLYFLVTMNSEYSVIVDESELREIETTSHTRGNGELRAKIMDMKKEHLFVTSTNWSPLLPIWASQVYACSNCVVRMRHVFRVRFSVLLGATVLYLNHLDRLLSKFSLFSTFHESKPFACIREVLKFNGFDCVVFVKE